MPGGRFTWLWLPRGSASVSIRRPLALLAAVAGGAVGGSRSDRGERRGLGSDGMDRIHRASELRYPTLCQLALQQLLLAAAQLGHDQMAP